MKDNKIISNLMFTVLMSLYIPLYLLKKGMNFIGIYHTEKGYV